jgi:hypothetical protein
MTRHAEPVERWRGRGFRVRRSTDGATLVVKNVPARTDLGESNLVRIVQDVVTGQRYRVTDQQGIVEPVE